MKKRVLSLLMSLSMVLSLVVVSAAAEETTEPTAEAEEAVETTADTTEAADTEESAPLYPDVPDEFWGKDAIEKWSGYGLVQGDATGFRPSATATRAEYAQILVNLMGYSAKDETITFADLTGDEWYADAILKLATAGIMQGDGTNCNAEATITRQEAFVLFGRAIGMTEDAEPDLSDYTDAADVASWATGMVSAMVGSGIVSGSGDGTLQPNANIDRASAVAMVDKAVAVYVNEAGTYQLDAESGLAIVASADEVTLSGDAGTVLVAPACAGGNVTLSGLKADAVSVNAELALTTAGNTRIGELNLNAEADVTLARGTTVTDLNANAAATVENNGTVTNLNANASGVIYDGKAPASLTVAEGVEAPTDSNGKVVTAKPASSGGSGSSGGGTTTPPTATRPNITVGDTVYEWDEDEQEYVTGDGDEKEVISYDDLMDQIESSGGNITVGNDKFYYDKDLGEWFEITDDDEEEYVPTDKVEDAIGGSDTTDPVI